MAGTDIVFLNDLKEAVAEAVHQCNNHLAIILSNSELLLAVQSPDSVTKKSESTITRVALLTDLLAQLNQLSSLDLSTEKTDLKKFLHHEVTHLSSLAQAEGLEVSTQFSCDGEYSIRSHVLRLLLHFLFRNAVSATRNSSEKKIAFMCSVQNNRADLEIKNSGAAPENVSQDFVFSSFFASKKQSSCDFLGASACLARLLGGEISYSRVAENNIIKVTFAL